MELGKLEHGVTIKTKMAFWNFSIIVVWHKYKYVLFIYRKRKCSKHLCVKTGKPQYKWRRVQKASFYSCETLFRVLEWVYRFVWDSKTGGFWVRLTFFPRKIMISMFMLRALLFSFFWLIWNNCFLGFGGFYFL